MNRQSLALAIVGLGALGLLAFEILPWVDVTTERFAQATTPHSYGLMEPTPSRNFVVPTDTVDEDAWVDVRASLGFVESGLLWGTALAAVAALAPFVRPFDRALAEALAFAGSGAIVGASFATVGLVLFAINVPELDAALAEEAGSASISIVAPLVVGAFVLLVLLLAASHLARSIAPARRAFSEARPLASQVAPVGAASAGAVTATARVPAASTPAGALPLPLAREAVLKRIARAREHARAYAARTGADPAMATWLQQMGGYLDGAESRARITTDPTALETIDRELDKHVFSLR